MITNNVNFNITDDEVATAIEQLNAARQTLAAYLTGSLTPQQRHDLFKMGKDSREYMDDNFNYAQDKDLRSPTLDITEWSNDVHTTNQLGKVFAVLEPLYFDIMDMVTIAGNEAMQQAQVNYRYIRYKANESEPKARAAYESLKNLRWNQVRARKNDKTAQ